jgi:outer membrane protein insertion porin family
VSGGFRSLIAKLFRRPTGVTRSQLSNDRDALESYYRLNGYTTATVATPVVNAKNDGTLTVDFPITEGPQTLVSSVTVEGAEQARAELPELTLKPGAPLNPQLERTDILDLQSFYADRGNAEVQVRLREDVSPDKKSAKVTYVVAEGPKIKIDEVVVRGNTYTNASVVLRQSQLERGNPFSYTSILEAQRNLYRMGIFERVEVQHEQTGTSVSDRNVVISVTEGKDLTVGGALGFSMGIDRTVSGSRFSLIGEVTVQHRNLFGTGRYLGLQLVESQNGERNEHVLSYREPFVGPYDVPVQFSLFQNDELRRGAEVNEKGFSMEATRVVFERTRWSLRYEYRLSDCTPHGHDVCALLKEGILTPGFDRTIGKINISSLTPTFFWDERDDPVNTTRGFFTSASVRAAFPFVRADAKFLKEFTTAAWYKPLTSRSTFVVSGRVGLIQPLGNPVPLTEKFTAGGDSSHRAYGLDLLGTICDPEDTGCRPTLVVLDGKVAPIGGNSELIANAEYRFPIFSAVSGALFVDAGNTFADSTVKFGDLRYGVGTGVRYLSPVGPLRLDFGYKLKRQITGTDANGKVSYERPYAVFLTIGYPF